MKTQYITDDSGKKVAVILPLKEYKKMMEDLEMLEDIKLYDKAKTSKQVFVDAQEAFEEIESKKK
jgi:PHD/YefM family antitoxin component YafN of YafNO toxin-antitoxin module